MKIGLGTPDDEPNRCSICELPFAEPAPQGAVAICANCAYWLARLRNSIRPGVLPLPSPAGTESFLRQPLHSVLRSFDSLDAVELVMEIEEEFDINLADDEAEQAKTVRDLIRVLSKRNIPG